MGHPGKPNPRFQETADAASPVPSPSIPEGPMPAEGEGPLNRITWFEIPVHSMARAVAFYSRVFGIEMEMTQNGEHAMAFFPATEGGLGGALVAGPGCVPSDTGTLVYLNVESDLQEALAQVELAGGRVILGKTALGEAGFFALFLDTEGNKLALHAAD